METTSQIVKRILKIAFPMAAARIINMVTVFIGMIMVARLGQDVLAASALITASYYTVMVTFMFVLFSVGVVVGRHYGAKKFEAIGDVVQQSFVLAFLLSIPMMLLFWYFGKILLAFGQSPKLVHYVIQYFHALVWVALPMLLLVAMSQFMFAVGRVIHVVCASLLGVLVFLLVAYPLIFGAWGAPKCGIAGFSYGILAQDVSSLSYLLLAYAFEKGMHRYGIFKLKRIRDRSIFKKLWTIGWPMSMQFGGELVGFFAITVLIGLLGIKELAAWQVVQQIMMIFIVPVFSFAEASAIIVGHSMGAKDYHNISKVNWISTCGALFFVVLGMLLFILIPDQLTHIYMSQENQHFESSLIHVISELFFINAFVYLFDSFRNLLSGSLRGLYDTQFPMIIGVIVVWVVGVGFGYILAFHTRMGIYGFATAQSIAFFFGAIAVAWRWRSQVRKLSRLTV